MAFLLFASSFALGAAVLLAAVILLPLWLEYAALRLHARALVARRRTVRAVLLLFPPTFRASGRGSLDA